MSTTWRYTAMILAGAVLLLGFGLSAVRSAVVESRGPRGMAETRKVLRQLGGAPGIAARREQLGKIRARLQQERTAQRADAAAFSRRIEEAFADLGLELTASSAWTPLPKVDIPGAAAFERTFAGTGPFDRLLDAVATFERWPDQVRVRDLSVTRQGPGKVAFTLKITAVRAPAEPPAKPPVQENS
jgi:hypothetical protein